MRPRNSLIINGLRRGAQQSTGGLLRAFLLAALVLLRRRVSQLATGTSGPGVGPAAYGTGDSAPFDASGGADCEYAAPRGALSRDGSWSNRSGPADEAAAEAALR